MELQEIKNRIHATFSSEVSDQLSDQSLMEVYKKQPSVQKRLNQFHEILMNFGSEVSKLGPDMTEEQLEILTNQYLKSQLMDLSICGQVKGNVRGKKFNSIVKEYVRSLNYSDEYSIAFEEQHPGFECWETPDFYIYHKPTKKLLIGLNQVDLWSGGAQKNRGSKYVTDDRFHKDYKSDLNIRLVSVISNLVEYEKMESKRGKQKGKKSKMFELFQIGFEKNRLCYLNGLKDILDAFFKTEE